MDLGILAYAREGETPRVFNVRPGVTSIGSAPQNDLIIQGPGVAPFHARILSTVNEFYIIDQGSQDGTFLNQVQLRPHARFPLRPGDTLRIGPYFFRYTGYEQGQTDDLGELLQGIISNSDLTRSRKQVLPPDVMARLSGLSARGVRGLARLPVRRLRSDEETHLKRVGPFGDSDRSYLLRYLPPCFHENEFLERLLLLFETVERPLEQMLDFIHYYFDPELAPEAMVPWLATWVDLVVSERWPIERRRSLIKSAAELYRWRGTRKGLSEYLRIYSDVEPIIVEPSLDDEEQNVTTLPPHVIKVILEVPDPQTIDRQLVEAIIQSEKPAHVAYMLEIRPRSSEDDVVAPIGETPMPVSD